MHTNQQLIDHLIRTGILRTPRLIGAFERCDRILFVPEPLLHDAYGDYPLHIGEGQTISQPFTVAVMLELLAPPENGRILDIGSGSGWTTALLAAAVGEGGRVEGVERIASLVDYGRANLAKAHITNASIEAADPSALGKPGQRYDRILVSASAPELPTPLIDQLKAGGILVIPIQNSIWRITKNEEGKIEAYELSGFRFVPLILP